jgi:hypothetical protein
MQVRRTRTLAAGAEQPPALPFLYSTGQRSDKCVVCFRGLPRFGKTTPRASAVQRSRLASLSAWLRSAPGGIPRASSKASVARLFKRNLSANDCFPSLIAPKRSCCPITGPRRIRLRFEGCLFQVLHGPDWGPQKPALSVQVEAVCPGRFDQPTAGRQHPRGLNAAAAARRPDDCRSGSRQPRSLCGMIQSHHRIRELSDRLSIRYRLAESCNCAC